MNNILYSFLYAWAKLHGVLPMRILYILSDLFYIIIYKLVGYRLKVVRKNMKKSFPDKSAEELKKLEQEFYHHFCDYVVETLKL